MCFPLKVIFAHTGRSHLTLVSISFKPLPGRWWLIGLQTGDNYTSMFSCARSCSHVFRINVGNWLLHGTQHFSVCHWCMELNVLLKLRNTYPVILLWLESLLRFCQTAFLISSRCCVQQETEKENLKCYSFPFPAGTIWMQEILPLVLNGGDLTPLQTIANWDRVPWLEEKRLAMIVDKLPAPRAMVTHFPYHLMPPSLHTSKAKVSFLYSHLADTEYNFEICFCLRWFTSWETPRTFWCLHTISTKWPHFSRIQEHLTNLWPLS